MAEVDQDSKTEEPSEKKIADALEKGNVPRSREMSILASLMGILLVLAFLLGPGAASLSGTLLLLVDHPAAFAIADGNDATTLLGALGMEVGKFLLPMIVILAVAGIAAAFFQHAPKLALEQIRPKWSRVSPGAGWKRIFGVAGQVEFLKAVGKFLAVGIVVMVMLGSDRDQLLDAIYSDPSRIPGLVLALSVKVVAVVGVAILLLVAGDVVWSRLRWRQQLRMTRQEVKDELKQAEGDPLVKARLRSLSRDRARRRMIAEVPKATLIVANPTHFAVALRYIRGKDSAPQVVAKGADLIALRIREVAEAHGIPVFEDKPLARALYDAVEVNQWIPPEFYKAVARLLYVLYSRKTAHARA
ncbi:MAG TPA: flagellar biosynthesis protein FlhB [Bauldia sp.]|nr:flagellar biosynthesis protein FlhB [Bauldia sp.]